MRLKKSMCMLALLTVFGLCACDSQEYKQANESTELVNIDNTETANNTVLESFLEGVDKNAAWYGERFIDCMEDASVCDGKAWQVKAVHDWFMVNVEVYNESETVSAWANEAEGALVHGKATAKGYNKAFVQCMNAMGVPCVTVKGTYNGKDTEWINVELEGGWYHIDLIANDTYSEYGDKISYKYFNVTDDELIVDHSWSNNLNCKDVKYGYYDYYYKETKIYSHKQFISSIAENLNRKELLVVVKDGAMLKEQLWDYESVSKRSRKLVIWRVSEVMYRGSFSIYRLYINVPEESIYPEFAHSAKDFYAIMNKAMVSKRSNYVIVVDKGVFAPDKYIDWDKYYTDEHNGYVTNYSMHKVSLTSSSYIDTKADALVAGYDIIKLDCEYMDNLYGGGVVTTTQQIIDYVVKEYKDNNGLIGYGTSIAAKVVVREGGDVNMDIKVIEKGLKEKYPEACIDEMYSRIEQLRPGYKLWSLSVSKEKYK